MTRLAKVRWLDSWYHEGEQSIDAIVGGVELTYYGLMIKEDEVAVTLAMESPHDGRTRNPFSILRRNIIEIEIVDARKAFPKKRPKTNEPKTPEPEAPKA